MLYQLSTTLLLNDASCGRRYFNIIYSKNETYAANYYGLCEKVLHDHEAVASSVENKGKTIEQLKKHLENY